MQQHSFFSQKYSVTECSFHFLHEPLQKHDEAGDNQEILLFDVIIFLRRLVQINFAH